MTATEEPNVQARTFVRGHLQVELALLLSNPFQRPAGWAILIAAVPLAAFSWSLLAGVWPWPAAAAVSVLLGLAAAFTLWMVVTWTGERRGFRRARYRWLTDDGAAAAGAYAQLDRKGRLTLYSVWAIPQGHGHGATLLRQIITDTDPHDLWLVADNRRAARFYQRHGFQHVCRELLGHRMLLAPATSSAESASSAGLSS